MNQASGRRENDGSAKMLFGGFLAVWLLLNLVQGAFTELDPDEAYYWMYSQALDWGYFDHPPMIALMIRAGYACFHNELGVRAVAILLQTGTFFFIWLLAGQPANRRDTWVLIALLAALPLFQTYGFIAAPDAPLLFFGAVFLWLYRRFLHRTSLLNALLLGGCMAALLYSKYHGILLIGLVTLSNLRALLRTPAFYAASIFGCLLFMPHLYWQYIQEFPSFRYHLSGRDDPYELKHTFTYLLNQPVIFNPLLFPLILKAVWKADFSSKERRSWLFLIVGFWAFFFWATFKGHAEPQWTGLLAIPLVLLTYEYAIDREVFRRWVFRLAILTVAGFAVGRLLLATAWIPLPTEFQNRKWVESIQKEAGSLPVVFQNSYRNPSKYAFYTGQRAYTFTDVFYRKSQYDLWDWETALHNQSALIVGHDVWKCTTCKVLEIPWKNDVKEVKVLRADSLQVAGKLVITPSHHTLSAKPGTPIPVFLQIKNPYPFEIRQGVGNMPLTFSAMLFDGVQEAPVAILDDVFVLPRGKIAAGAIIEISTVMTFPETLSGHFTLIFGAQTGQLPPGINSGPVKLSLQK
ncbi:MAG: glycosyltransferase family 39 protein [Saprospiraceae bacterium]|nr:glycosyltransferase family 39 protein [Saprospiraceae bacterium]